MATYSDIRYNMTLSSSTTGGGSLVLLATETASSDATISFTSNIDSTYKEYVFRFYDIHPATNDVSLTFQADTGTNTSYNQTMTTTFFQARHNEADTTAAVAYTTGRDIAQGTGFQRLHYEVGNGNDESCTGTLHIFDPSNTTFVKHFYARANNYGESDESADCFVAGYFDTTTALTRFQFKMTSGNIDAGVIKMYGVV